MQCCGFARRKTQVDAGAFAEGFECFAVPQVDVWELLEASKEPNKKKNVWFVELLANLRPKAADRVQCESSADGTAAGAPPTGHATFG